MTARLFSRTGETRGSEIEIDGEAIIGRDRASTLMIDRPLMSSRHARIAFDADQGRYVLEDLDSLNGTALDGDRVTGLEPLGHLHVITFAGTYDFFFQDLERCRRRHPHPPAEAPRPAATARPPAPPSAGPVAADDAQEITAVESEPVALPGFLARRADALSEEHGEPESSAEITRIERDAVVLPGSLARRADRDRREAAAESTAAESTAAESTAAEPAADDSPKREGTVREKLPVPLPGELARRADEAGRGEAVQKHQTVDLAEIEELIAADAEAARGARRTIAYHLVITESGGRVLRFTLAQGTHLIGRGRDADVALDYPDLSRRHARLTLAGEEIRLRDLGSRNRTFLDDAPLAVDVDVEVRPGARLRFGSVEARLVRGVSDGDSPDEPKDGEGA